MPFTLDGEGPLYQQVYRALRAEILAQSLAPGARLPSTRSLAGDLGVSRKVAMLAYGQLLGEGYAQARTGSGTIVARSLPEEWRAALPGAQVRRVGRPRRMAPRLSHAAARAMDIGRRPPLGWGIGGPGPPRALRFGRRGFG